MIHPPDVIGKYAPDAVIGVLDDGKAAPAAAAGAATTAAAAAKPAVEAAVAAKGTLHCIPMMIMTPVAILALPLAMLAQSICG